MRLLPIFGEKIGVFLKQQCYDKFLKQNLALFSVKKLSEKKSESELNI
jgi:hypothetical protein